MEEFLPRPGEPIEMFARLGDVDTDGFLVSTLTGDRPPLDGAAPAMLGQLENENAAYAEPVYGEAFFAPGDTTTIIIHLIQTVLSEGCKTYLLRYRSKTDNRIVDQKIRAKGEPIIPLSKLML